MGFNLKDKKIFITGSSGGIGTSLCKKFIENNCKIIFTSSDLEKLENLKYNYGDSHLYYPLDLSNNKNLADNIKVISDQNKDIDVLINNAGVTNDNLILRMKHNQWNDVIDINLNSNFYILKSILPNMIKNKKGKIIGITSVVAVTGNPGQSNYTAAKSGMIGMYKSLALEVAQRNININLIAPGFIESPMTNKLDENQRKIIMDKIPMKKFGTSEDVAHLALFLASDLSSYITGETFHINGGMLMV